MNKTALKNFATWSRRKLIEQVQTKAFLYGIDEKNNSLHIEEQFGQLLINGQSYPLSMKTAFTALQKQLNQKGYKQLLEEAAYTWFNRIIAIRFMEAREYLPERVNVLSSSVGRVDPDILFEYDTMDLNIKQEEVRELINAGNTEAAYRILFVAQCNALNRILPFMFEQIQDFTELLLPDFLLDAESVIKTLVQNEELTESFAEIEVIGWLYQYYIAEEKDRVFAQKSKYKKEEIPFATQLFTPKWIVQYMVQNSLGRYWTEAHREDEDLIDFWEYFIKHEEDFYEKIAPYVNKELKVEDIKLLDPAMGSGHILVYAFEVFHEIYAKCGYPERDIPRLILENNLYGLDIDDRAYQLAAFAVVMKAAQYSRRFLRSVEREGIHLNLASIQETNYVSDDVIAYIAQQEVGEQYNRVKAFFDQYHNAKTYGSLINITEREISFIEERFRQIKNNPVENLFYAEQHEIAKEVLPALIHQTQIMSSEYDVVVMNPPYMGNGSMSKELSEFMKKFYPDSKADLFAAFMEVYQYLKVNGYYTAINQHSWMFLSSFEKLREKIINTKFIDTMLHLGPRAFEEISGEVVQSTAFMFRNASISNLKGIYFRLVEEKTALEKREKVIEAVSNLKWEYRYSFEQENFSQIPGRPIAYWISKVLMKAYQYKKLGEIAEPRHGLATSNNDYFLKRWYELDIFKTSIYDRKNHINYKWLPINKGGHFRKWYGNNEWLINYENDGKEIKDFAISIYKNSTRTIQNTKYYFLESLTWSALSSGRFSVRWSDEGAIFGSGGYAAFVKEDLKFYILALMNNKVTERFISIVSSTLNFEVGHIKTIPVISDDEKKSIINKLVEGNIEISKSDWDCYETSWDFAKHPFIKESTSIVTNAFKRWADFAESQYNQLKANEEELNRIFIEMYGLQDELTPDVEDKDVTVRKADLDRDVRSFLSYFIGCMVGRYSLDVEGLAYAGREWDSSKYTSFQPTKNNGVVHFTDSAYFENDVITRLREFLAVAFATDTVEENMQWLAEALEMKNGEDAETRIRRYFLDEFFTDHYKMYQKRPIYWLVDSGKQKGLRTLIYMHRYQPDTMATIRFENLQEIQAKYQQEIADLENRLVNPNLSATNKKKLNAEKVSFEKKIDELREFDKRLATIAAEEIEIDLDDGVKVNYEKFYRGGKGVLAKIK